MDFFNSIPPPFPEPKLQDEEIMTDDEKSIVSDNAESTNTSNERKSPRPTKKELEEKAIRLKEEAAQLIKLKEYNKAKNLYTEALDCIKSNESEIDQDDVMLQSDFPELRTALSSNLCLCHMKLEEWYDTIHTASDVLKTDPDNVKALYRRGYSRLKLGLLEEAKIDLLKAHNIDSSMTEIRQALVLLKTKLQEFKALDKERIAGLFDRAKGLYEDKEILEKARKKKEEEEALKEKLEFDKANEKRVEKGGKPFESIQAWKDSKTAETPNASSKKKTNIKASKPTPEPSSADQAEFDEEDRKILHEVKNMGYCYFNKNKNQTSDLPQEKKAPIKLNNPSNAENVTQNAKSLSEWNAAGTTYEERDCTTWLTQQFESELAKCQASTTDYHIKVTKVNISQCDAQIVVLRSSKRYLYDCSCDLSWELCPTSESLTKASGTITFSDISSSTSTSSGEITNPDWIKYSKVTYDTKNMRDSPLVESGIKDLKLSVYNQLKVVEQIYKSYK